MAALLEVKTTRFREEEEELLLACCWREERRERVPFTAGRRQSFRGSENVNWQGEAVWRT